MRYAKITPATVVGQPAPVPWLIADDSIRGPGSRFLEEGWPGFDLIARETAYLNGSFVVNEVKGNRAITFNLLVDHQFADESECFLFIAQMPLQCPGGGMLELGTLGTGGAVVYYPNAVIESVKPVNVTVVSVKLLYTIKAGAPGAAT